MSGILQKCSECSVYFDESSVVFFRRTKNIFNPNPAFCRDCSRIKNAMNPTEKQKKLWIKKELIKRTKKQLKENIKNFSDQQFLKDQIIISKDKDRKRYRLEGSLTRAKRKKGYIYLNDIEKKQIVDFYEKCPFGYHVDHIIPLTKGGKHCLFNLQYLPQSKNISKGNKIAKKTIIARAKGKGISINFFVEKFRMEEEDAQNLVKQIKC